MTPSSKKTKLGLNPFEGDARPAAVVFPGDPIPAFTPTPHEETMNRKTLRPRLPRSRAELLETLEGLREIRPSDISQKILRCRMDQFSLFTVARKGRTSSVSVLGLRLTHPFKLKNRSIKIGPVAARNWKLTLLDVQLRKSASRK